VLLSIRGLSSDESIAALVGGLWAADVTTNTVSSVARARTVDQEKLRLAASRLTENTRRRSGPSIMVRRRRHFAGPKIPSGGLLQNRQDWGLSRRAKQLAFGASGVSEHEQSGGNEQIGPRDNYLTVRVVLCWRCASAVSSPKGTPRRQRA
jgi:hypothetical protein